MASLDLYLIQPTRYDDDGYPLQWLLSLIPSNSLACVAGIAPGPFSSLNFESRFGIPESENV